MFSNAKNIPSRVFQVARVFQFLQKQPHRHRQYWNNMECTALQPPNNVRGMLHLEREAFSKFVQVPRLRVREEQANRVLPLVKKLLLKMEHLRPVRQLEASNDREILLHPLPVESWSSLPTVELENLEVNESDFYFEELKLCYVHWRADEIFKSVFPEGEEGLTSYSRIGHIVHLNLREHLLPYKQLIGEVLCDKVASCRTVVNKANTIDNTYRNFQLELICGEEQYQVKTKENGVTFEFDFSKVYWNPRLSTEHERIVQLLQPGDVLYDVFAGVGPFSVPAARKRCIVLANDLNPESFRWLQHNATRNKCLSHINFFNKDGRDFILHDLKKDLLQRWQEPKQLPKYRIHITMNLPAMAVEFLDAFRALYAEEATQLDFDGVDFNYPIVHVYAFAKGEDTNMLVFDLVQQHLGAELRANLDGVYFVRNVAPSKDMYRVSFYLSKELLTTSKCSGKTDEAKLGLRKRNATNDAATETELNTKLKCN